MLLNNFKPLLFFGGNGTFKDVSGTSVNVSSYIQAASYEGVINSHSTYGTTRSFDYTATAGSNSYTEEQTAQSWQGIVHSGDADLSQDKYRKLANGFILFVGTGDTAVTASDYKLATPANLSVTSASCETDANGIVTVSRTFKNTTGSDVTIKEMGLYVFRDTNPYEVVSNYAVMVGRKVLDNPVTIPNGEQRTFEYIIDMSNINFSEADS